MSPSWQTRIKRRLVRASLMLPSGIRRALAGRPVASDRGVALDPEVHWLLTLERWVAGGLVRKSVAESRRGMRESVYLVEGPRRPIHTVQDLVIAKVPCRRYFTAEGLPRLVYVHGGGWVAGDLETHDGLCRRLASAGVEVIAVDYRLAPEHPFPQGLEDVIAVFRAVCDERPGPVALGGDSAGGNLTVAASLRLREQGKSLPDLMVLLYPGTDQLSTTGSRARFATGFVLEDASIRWYQDHYLPADQDWEDPLVSPLRADHSGLPPAIVCTAGFDPLRDEGEALVDKLRAVGLAVQHLDAASQVHGFLAMDGVSPGADAEIERIESAVAHWAQARSIHTGA